MQGYLSILGHMVPLHSEHRSLGLPVTTDPQEFTHTPGQVVVTRDGSSVIVTTKAAGNSLLVFGRYGLAQLTKTPAVVDEAGNVPFAAVFDRFGRLGVAEAGSNSVATYAVEQDRDRTDGDLLDRRCRRQLLPVQRGKQLAGRISRG